MLYFHFTRYTQAASNFSGVHFLLCVGVGILCCPKIAAEVSFQKQLGVLALKACHLGSASSMVRTTLVQVFNCFRTIFRSINLSFQNSATKARSSYGVGELREEPGGKPMGVDRSGSGGGCGP